MIEIFVIPESPDQIPRWTCAEVRLLRPFAHPTMVRQVRVKVGFHPHLPAGRIDAVVMQRGGPFPSTLEEVVGLVRQIRARRIPLLYDLDDDLLTTHPVEAVEHGLRMRRAQTRFLLREADAVITSTSAMASRIRHINANCFVWENSIDDALILTELERPPKGEEGAALGYVGTLTHLPDLMSVIAPVEAGLAALPCRKTVEFVGVSEDSRLSLLLGRIAEVSVLPVIGDYARFLRWLQERPPWQVGLVPLAGNSFNACKSDIKFLDYAISGIVGVYQKSPVYDSVVDGETGLVAESAEFGTALRRLLSDGDERQAIRERAREYVIDNRRLSLRVPRLWETLQQVLDKAR